jgi:hypothetical protein
VVRHLRGKGPVRVALEVVDSAKATALWGLRSGSPNLDLVPEKLGWTWRGSYTPWRPLFALGLTEVPGSVDLVAAGPPVSRPAFSEARPVDVPEAEPERLAALTGNLPVSWRLPLAVDRAWADSHIADYALKGWSEDGILVVVVDHTRVAASSGVSWHLAEQTSIPVRAALVSATTPDCAGGAQAWAAAPSGLRVALRRVAPAKSDEAGR